MDAYFTAIYDHVHTNHPTPTIRVLTPPMSQNYLAETKRFGRNAKSEYFCEESSLAGLISTGYSTMSNVFLTGAKNDGYTWHNYWGTGFEARGDCDPNASPHGHHLARFFPTLMFMNMVAKPRYITEADLESPASAEHWGTLADKDDLLGLTAANSLNQFIESEVAERVAVWALNITMPRIDPRTLQPEETNWHEAYRCNDIDQSGLPLLERPWFTLWWTGWPGWPAFCYRTYLSGIMKDYTTELIKNGTFAAGGAYWTTTTSQSSCTSPGIFGTIDGNNAADLGRCNYNMDTVSQMVTIPDNVTSATLVQISRGADVYWG
jgi:hypothetical protein